MHDLPKVEVGAVVARGADWGALLTTETRERLRRGERDVYASSRERFDQALLAAALAENDDHRGRAALQLGLGRNTLTRKLGSTRRRDK